MSVASGPEPTASSRLWVTTWPALRASAWAVELIRKESRPTAHDRTELRRLLSKLSANELLALQANLDFAKTLRKVGQARDGDRWLVICVLVLLAVLVWIVASSALSDEVLLWDESNSTQELGSWHG